jgi:MFS family permease
VLALFTSLLLLGLSAIDPIGIAAMPLLLTQRKPFLRSFVFLGGSFVSLMVMGVLFARGIGATVVNFENAHSWVLPVVQIVAGLMLLGIGGALLRHLKTKPFSAEPPASIAKQLRLSNWHLFVAGAALVIIQSIADVVFVIAMIRIGQLYLASVTLIAAVATYAIAALVLQLAVVGAYALTPEKQKAEMLEKVHSLLTRYSNQVIIGVSLLLGCALLLNGLLAALDLPHL